MKWYSFLFLLTPVFAIAQKPCNCLCTANETNVYSFQTISKKTVSLCQEKSAKYLVYRFGTPAKTELQYPEQLVASSWQKFTYRFYMRGGGVENDAKDLNWVSFTNKDVEYTVYSEYYSETNSVKVGITVTLPEGKNIDIKGIPKSQTGTLIDFRDNTKITKEDF